MLRRLRTQALRRTALGLAIVSLFASTRAYAQNWNQTSGTPKVWNNNSFWDTNVFPNAIDASATIPVYATGTQRINLSQPITVGSLSFVNPVGGTTSPTIAPNAGTAVLTNTLTFDSSSGTATLTNPLADSTSTSVATISAPVVLGSNLLVEQDNDISDNGGVTFSGGVSSAGFTLQKNGPGNIAITADSPNFIAPVVINGGAVRVTGNWLSASTGVTVNSGGQFQLGANLSDWSLGAGAVLNLNGSGKASGVNSGGALRQNNASAITNFDNPVNLQSTSTIDTVGAASQLTLTQPVSGVGGLIKADPGTLVLGGTTASTYGGSTTINGGTLLLSKPDGVAAVPGDISIQNPTGANQGILKLGANNQIADTSNVTLLQSTGTGTPNGLFSLNGFQETIGGLNSTLGAGIVQNGAAAGASTLSINAATAASSFSGVLQDGGNGTLALAISGAQAVTLSGASTYSGGTSVTGALVVNNTTGSATGTGPVTVTGGSLGGSGFIGGSVSFVGGVLAPGNSPGTLTLGAASFDLASLLNYQLGAPGVVGSGVNDLTEVLGDLSLAGTLNVTPLANFGAGVYRLFDYTGQLTSFSLTLGSLPTGFSGSFDTSIPGQVNLNVSSVPEPASVALAGMGLMLLAGARLQSRRSKRAVIVTPVAG